MCVVIMVGYLQHLGQRITVTPHSQPSALHERLPSALLSCLPSHRNLPGLHLQTQTQTQHPPLIRPTAPLTQHVLSQTSFSETTTSSSKKYKMNFQCPCSPVKIKLLSVVLSYKAFLPLHLLWFLSQSIMVVFIFYFR